MFLCLYPTACAGTAAAKIASKAPAAAHDLLLCELLPLRELTYVRFSSDNVLQGVLKIHYHRSAHGGRRARANVLIIAGREEVMCVNHILDIYLEAQTPIKPRV